MDLDSSNWVEGSLLDPEPADGSREWWFSQPSGSCGGGGGSSPSLCNT